MDRRIYRYYRSTVIYIAVLVVVNAPDRYYGSDRYIAAHYAKGKFERVERRRGLAHASCNLASPFHRIGEWVSVEGVRTGVSKICRVSDTSQPIDRKRHIRMRLVELDYQSARSICGRYFRDPPRECPVIVKPVKGYRSVHDAKDRRIH